MKRIYNSAIKKQHPTSHRLPHAPFHPAQPNKGRKHSNQKPGIPVFSLESQTLKKKKKQHRIWHPNWKYGFKQWSFISVEPIQPGIHTTNKCIVWFSQINSAQRHVGENCMHTLDITAVLERNALPLSEIQGLIFVLPGSFEKFFTSFSYMK